MTTDKEKSAFYLSLAKLNKEETSGEKGYKFLVHPTKFFKLALNPKGEVSLVTDNKRNSNWISTVKAYKTRLDQNKLLSKLHKENFFLDMENYNASLKEIKDAKEEGIIKEDYLF